MQTITDDTWTMLQDTRKRFEAIPADKPEAYVVSDPLPEHVARVASRRLNDEGASTIAYLAESGTRDRGPVWVVLFGGIPIGGPAVRWES